MGGRVAIMLSLLNQIKINKTSVIDIGPFKYAGSTQYEEIIGYSKKLKQILHLIEECSNRKDCTNIMSKHGLSNEVIALFSQALE